LTIPWSESEIRRFRAELLGWFARFGRDLPWRRTRDPYSVLVSEIMLQQTRVQAALPYYERFLTRFPTVQSVAEASESELLTHWAGLGYYHRARNLQAAARLVRDAGEFPSTADEIRKLPGVGAYTAAAVASISFNLAEAALDGNVFRVLSRVFNDATKIGSGFGRKHFSALANELLDPHEPGMFNQAMMDLGATICLPQNPQCLVCPVAGLCGARKNGRENDLPVKKRPRSSVDRKRVLFWIEQEGELLLWQRASTARFMPGFWELPEKEQLPGAATREKLGSFRHGITFHRYAFDVELATVPDDLGDCQWVPVKELASRPVSTVVKKAKKVVERNGRERGTVSTAATSGTKNG
jgi:A/G-specific adenine glycosylase